MAASWDKWKLLILLQNCWYDLANLIQMFAEYPSHHLKDWHIQFGF